MLIPLVLGGAAVIALLATSKGGGGSDLFRSSIKALEREDEKTVYDLAQKFDDRRDAMTAGALRVVAGRIAANNRGEKLEPVFSLDPDRKHKVAVSEWGGTLYALEGRPDYLRDWAVAFEKEGYYGLATELRNKAATIEAPGATVPDGVPLPPGQVTTPPGATPPPHPGGGDVWTPGPGDVTSPGWTEPTQPADIDWTIPTMPTPVTPQLPMPSVPEPGGGLQVPAIPPEVQEQIAAVLASGDVAALRHLANWLRTLGLGTQADQLDARAEEIESSRPKPVDPPPPSLPPVIPVPEPLPIPPVVQLPPTTVATLPPGFTLPTMTLRDGNYGPSTTAWQQFLAWAGYLQPHEVDGQFGPKTTAATKAFQAAMGLNPDGIVGPSTYAAAAALLAGDAVNSTPAAPAVPAAPAAPQPSGYQLPPGYKLQPFASTTTLRDGNYGQSTTAWQQFLAWAGFLQPHEIDGQFGPKTTAATKAWQQSRGLAVDGIVGPQAYAAARVQLGQAGIVGSPQPGTIEARRYEVAERLNKALKQGEKPQSSILQFQIQEGKRRLGRDPDGVYDGATALLIASYGFVPAPPHTFLSEEDRRFFCRQMAENAERDPVRADEWAALSRL